MKPLLIPALVILAALVAAVALWPPTALPDVSCRNLRDDPEFFAGRVVRLSTVGMTPGQSPTELVYRRFASKPPLVVARLSRAVPFPLPAYVVGTVTTERVDGITVVVLVNCRPE